MGKPNLLYVWHLYLLNMPITESSQEKPLFDPSSDGDRVERWGARICSWLERHRIISTSLALLLLFSAAFQTLSSPYYVLYVSVATGVRYLSRGAPLSASALSIQAYSLGAWAMYMLVVWVQILLRERTESTFAVGSAADSAWSWQGTFVEAYMQSGLAASCVAHSPFLIGAFVLGKAWGLEERTGRKEEQTEEGNYQVDDKP